MLSLRLVGNFSLTNHRGQKANEKGSRECLPDLQSTSSLALGHCPVTRRVTKPFPSSGVNDSPLPGTWRDRGFVGEVLVNVKSLGHRLLELKAGNS